jgi:hypothetical protein
MRLVTREIDLYGTICSADLMEFDKSDTEEWLKLWDSWKTLKMGLRAYKTREPNLPEGLSETAFCMYSGSHRLVDIKGNCNKSADTYNLDTMEAEQIKASSVERDLTSFGPKTKWDKLYFLDFYRDGTLDGSFDVYEIDKNLIYNTIVNKGKKQTFRDQQNLDRRPRLSLKEDVIKVHGIKPKDINVRIWI